MNFWLADILHDFINLVYPEYCLSCSNTLVKGEQVVCTECMLMLPKTNHHLHPDNTLRTRLSSRIPLKYAMALFRFKKSSRVQRLLYALKYKNHPEIGITLGEVYGQKLMDENYHSAFDLILPVPLHKNRQRKRGYNQSAKFAEGLSRQMGIPFTDDLLKRNVQTQTQTRKTKLARWENVNEIFSVTDSSRVLNKKILLVDDVITTGSTIEACCQVLLQNGCLEISVACIAEA